MIEKSSVEKYLGVYDDKELEFSKHVETQANKSNKLLGLIRHSYKTSSCLLRPNLESGNAVWSPRLKKGKNLIDSVQRMQKG
jgi:hypothetical protein